MIPGYNTNGLAHHSPMDGLRLLADTGYKSVAITVDHGWFTSTRQTADIKRFLTEQGMSSVIETGARFILDPRQKHSPTLLDPDPAAANQRIEFLKRCIDLAVELGSNCVSLWSGRKDPRQSPQDAMGRLKDNLSVVLSHAESVGVDIGFEPEPGMLVDTTSSFGQLLEQVSSPRLKMTMDIGHLHCLGEIPIADYIRRWSGMIVNIHLEDMVRGKHEHLMFGEGEIDFAPVIQSLREIGYKQGIHVELSRHSHNAAEIVRQAFGFLQALLEAKD